MKWSTSIWQINTLSICILQCLINICKYIICTAQQQINLLQLSFQPIATHLHAVKHILRFPKGTLSLYSFQCFSAMITLVLHIWR